ncbi:hypothetical protein JQD07_004022 [Escherichia coli]|nr:hypothetical protein [Escherichia coli]EHD7195388.1 hypothetical protein [Escherichia coli]MCQ1672249.1 hypothetical protein [Escherichia coli]
MLWPLQPPESPQRETGRRGGGGRADNCAIRRSFLTHRQVCRERRSRRDRGGATGTVAASQFFRHRTVAAARNRASGFGGDWRVRQQLPVGVGPDDRMPPGSREPKVSPPPGVRTTETTKQKNASHHDGQEGQRRRRGPPAFQAGVSLPGFSGGLAGHTPAGAGE